MKIGALPSRVPTIVPSQQTAKLTPIPPPNGGINASGALAGGMQPTESVFQYNLIPSQWGSKVRTGYRQFAVGVDPDGIRTIIPFNGNAENKLFAAGKAGIYDITAGGSGTWTASPAFVLVGTTSGLGQWTAYSTIGGKYVLYTDEMNGYHVYTEGSGWAKIAEGTGAGEVSGMDPDTVAGVMIWKTRVWFIQKNSSKSYFLNNGSIYGEATEFDWGNKFRHGGTLSMLINWTIDGGEGVDDYLVAISTSGDVVIYKGTDPSDANKFSQHGSWYIGDVPAGRRIAGSFGGEVYILSRYGLLPLSKLVSGAVVDSDDIYITRKITPYVNNEMAFTRTSLGWEVKLIPSEQLLLVSSPKRSGFDYQQFVQSLNNQAWAIYRDIPYFTGEVYQDVFYIGGPSGTVFSHTGSVDAADVDGEGGVNIEWSVLQAFSDLGDPGLYHIAQFIRPVFLAEQAPSYMAEVRYDYDLSEVFGASSAVVTLGAVWDSALWDGSLWGGGYVVAENAVGANGIGRSTAVAMQGSSGTKTILVRYDLIVTTGGPL